MLKGSARVFVNANQKAGRVSSKRDHKIGFPPVLIYILPCGKWSREKVKVKMGTINNAQ